MNRLFVNPGYMDDTTSKLLLRLVDVSQDAARAAYLAIDESDPIHERLFKRAAKSYDDEINSIRIEIEKRFEMLLKQIANNNK